MNFLYPLLSLFAILLLTACEKSDEEGMPNVAYLSADAHLTVADIQLTLPFVAITSVVTSANEAMERRKQSHQNLLLERAGDPARPLKTLKTSLDFSPYGTYGEYPISQAICPRLSQDWAISICHNQKPESLKDLPQTFTLVERSAAASLTETTTVGHELRSDQLARMKLGIGAPEIVCDAESKFCTAAVAVSPGAIAVWTVWSSQSPPESSEEMGTRQGKAIHWFINDMVRAR